MALRLLPLLAPLLATASALFAAEPAPPQGALDAIAADDMLKHITVLSSDPFEGRAPGSQGEQLTVKYISEQFKAIGLRPGNPNGTYIQEVPLAGIKTD